MRKKEFFEELEEYLVGIPKEEKEEIIQDYKEHFRMGKRKKRSEAEIITSLGDPKEIAREMRRESSSKKPELKSEAIETWVSIKRFTKHLFSDAEERIGNIISGDKRKRNKILPKIILGGLVVLALIFLLNSWLFKLLALIIIGYLIFNYIRNEGGANKNHPTKKVPNKKSRRKKEKRNSALKVILSIIFNLLFFIWFWLGLFIASLGLFIASLAIVVAGSIIIGFTIFALISHGNLLTKDLLFSGLFSGIGILLLGSLFTNLSGGIIRLYFRAARAYIELNSRFIKK